MSETLCTDCRVLYEIQESSRLCGRQLKRHGSCKCWVETVARYCNSGVTRVGVTLGGNWWCHHIFSWKKASDLFYLSLSRKWWPFFSCRLLTTPIFPRPLSSVISKFSPHKLILFGVSPGWCHPGQSAPHSDATVLEVLSCQQVLT